MAAKRSRRAVRLVMAGMVSGLPKPAPAPLRPPGGTPIPATPPSATARRPLAPGLSWRPGPTSTTTLGRHFRVPPQTAHPTLPLTSGSPLLGNSLPFPATLKTNGTTAGNAPGNFVFLVDGTVVTGNALSSGSASFTTTVAAGTHSIGAQYSGQAGVYN